MKSKGAENLSRKVTPEIISKLESIVGKDNVNTSEMDRVLYCHDLAPLPKEAGLAFNNLPDVIVRPKNMDELSKIVTVAYKSGVAITPRGASTWGLGGSMPAAGGILLDMSAKMNGVIKVDKTNMSVKAFAGCTWKNLLEACDKEGLIVPSYPSSFPSATLGGWISTGGIGVGSFKYGNAKDNILNLEVVLSDGTVITTGYDTVFNNMSGYNLNQIFAGAEGTLGVIGVVTLRVYPKGILKPTAYNFENLKDAQGPITEIINHPSVRPYHIVFSDYKHFENQRKAGIHAPEGVKNLIVVALQGAEEFVALEEKVIDEIFAKAGAEKVSDEVAAHEWDERCYEFRARKVGVGSIPAEVVVENAHWGEFVEECYKGYETMNMEPGGIIGEIADRSTALFMPYYFKDDENILGMTAFAYNFHMGERAALYGGRSTGLGVFFASNLDIYHDAGSCELMRDLKTFLDPHDIMNPGHLVCGKTRFGIDLSNQLMGVASVMLQGIKKLLPKDSTFESNRERFEYDEMEERKTHSRVVTYGKGTQ